VESLQGEKLTLSKELDSFKHTMAEMTKRFPQPDPGPSRELGNNDDGNGREAEGVPGGDGNVEG